MLWWLAQETWVFEPFKSLRESGTWAPHGHWYRIHRDEPYKSYRKPVTGSAILPWSVGVHNVKGERR